MELTTNTLDFQELFIDLVDEVCLDIAFEIHRQIKTNKLVHNMIVPVLAVETDKVDGYIATNGSTISNNLVVVKCPCCHETINGLRFAPHLEKCMVGGGRKSIPVNRLMVSNVSKGSIITLPLKKSDLNSISDFDSGIIAIPEVKLINHKNKKKKSSDLSKVLGLTERKFSKIVNVKSKNSLDHIFQNNIGKLTQTEINKIIGPLAINFSLTKEDVFPLQNLPVASSSISSSSSFSSVVKSENTNNNMLPNHLHDIGDFNMDGLDDFEMDTEFLSTEVHSNNPSSSTSANDTQNKEINANANISTESNSKTGPFIVRLRLANGIFIEKQRRILNTLAQWDALKRKNELYEYNKKNPIPIKIKKTKLIESNQERMNGNVNNINDDKLNNEQVSTNETKGPKYKAEKPTKIKKQKLETHMNRYQVHLHEFQQNATFNNDNINTKKQKIHARNQEYVINDNVLEQFANQSSGSNAEAIKRHFIDPNNATYGIPGVQYNNMLALQRYSSVESSHSSHSNNNRNDVVHSTDPLLPGNNSYAHALTGVNHNNFNPINKPGNILLI